MFGRRFTFGRSLIFLVPLIISIITFAALASSTLAAVEPQPTEAAGAKLYGLIAASLAVGLSGLGAGIAIFGSTSAGMAATVERPELTTWVLIFAGLGEGLAIYGLVVAIMILGKI
ncbi:ATPase [Candidatus Bathyarchaeota archaeon]|nr:ATPase [Candidatus Bathyarchaeota archaeon]MBS7629861.1 ATPase [Candidatus Bathyarchaeota archaeon]